MTKKSEKATNNAKICNPIANAFNKMNDKLFFYKSIYSSYLTFGFNVKNFYEKRVLCKGPLRRTGILEQYILYLQVYYTSIV